MMPEKAKRVHIVPTDNGWAARVEGQKRAAATAPTQKEAQDIARAQLQKAPHGGELITHGLDNKIRDSDTINRKDPNPPKG
jgi:hypothetical protein